jgi:tetratricopeptide (TPR) repeat protein
MKTSLALTTLAAGVSIAGGWVLVASITTKASASAIVLEPVVHAPYDAAKIDREIAHHEMVVRKDPGGAIGWGMLSGAYLARSRESDSDQFAWKAEDAAQKSLDLRTHRNQAAWLKVIQSLLEQHRFQDSLVKTEEGLKIYPGDEALLREKADILVEIGQLDAAEKLLKSMPVKHEGADAAPILARIASTRGQHEKSIQLYRQTLQFLSSNMSVPQSGLAWYITKIGTEQESMGDLEAAQRSFDESLKMYPRSYKAWLAEARLATKRKDHEAVIKACDEVQKIANSLDAVAMRADANKALRNQEAADRDYKEVRAMYEAEVKTFDSLGKGGPLHVKPIDRQFATFAASHHMYETEALPAAKRDLANRPDKTAKKNLISLTK